MTIFKFKKFTIFILIFFSIIASKLIAAEVLPKINDHEINLNNNFLFKFDLNEFNVIINNETNKVKKECYKAFLTNIPTDISVTSIELKIEESKKVILGGVAYYKSSSSTKINQENKYIFNFNCSYAEEVVD